MIHQLCWKTQKYIEQEQERELCCPVTPLPAMSLARWTPRELPFLKNLWWEILSKALWNISSLLICWITFIQIVATSSKSLWYVLRVRLYKIRAVLPQQRVCIFVSKNSVYDCFYKFDWSLTEIYWSVVPSDAYSHYWRLVTHLPLYVILGKKW